MTKSAKGFSALKDAMFRRYFFGAVFATNATWIFRVLLLWTAWDLTHSTSFTGIVTTMLLLPVALTRPIFGTWVDRTDPVRLYALVSVGYLLCPATLLVLSNAGALNKVAVLGIAIFYSLVVAVFQPLRQSLGPRLTSPDHIGSVMVLASLNHNAGRLIAPAIAGVVIAKFGINTASAMSIALYVPSILIAPTLILRASENRPEKKNFLRDFSDGFVTAWTHRPIRKALLLGVFTFGPISSLSEMITLVADGIFEKGAQGLGMMTSAFGIGALAASATQVMLGTAHLHNNLLRLAVIIVGLLSGGVMVTAASFEAALIAAVLFGFGAIMAAVSLQVSIQANVADHMRGRVMSLWMMSATLATSITAVGITWAAEYFGFQPVARLVFITALVIVTALALYTRDSDQPACDTTSKNA